MARNTHRAPPRLALFDRLLQGDSLETDRNADRAMRELRESVRRDLEILFNTRPRHLPIDPALDQLKQSIITFGLAELQGKHVSTPAQQKQLETYLQTLIGRFEPRFRDLSVTLMPNADALDRIMRFTIQAVLEADGSSEALVYDTVVDPVTGALIIREKSIREAAASS
jgi:type VI secretion system protein ImpF